MTLEQDLIYQASPYGETKPVEKKQPEAPIEGSTCVTDDGKQGTIVNGVCVAIEEEKPIEPEAVKPLEVPTPEPVAPQPQQVASWIPVEPQQEYAMPAMPTKSTNPYGSALSVYKAFGISTVPEVPIGKFSRPGILPFEWFNHNVPLAVWMPDNTIVKANNPDEFRQIVEYLQSNRGYLPSESITPEFTIKSTPEVVSLADIQTKVEAKRVLDTPERQAWDYLLIMQRRAQQAQVDIKTYEDLKEQYELAGGEGEPRFRGTQLAEYQRGKQAIGRYNLDALNEQVEAGKQALEQYKEAQDKYIQSISDTLSPIVEVFPVKGDTPESSIGFKTPGGWRILPDGSYESPEGETYPMYTLSENPELLTNYLSQFPKSEINKITDAQVADLITTYGSKAEPELKAIIKSKYPDINDDDLSRLFISISTKQQNIRRLTALMDMPDSLDKRNEIKFLTDQIKGVSMRPQTTQEMNDILLGVVPKPQTGLQQIPFRGEFAPENTPLGFLQRTPIGTMFSQPENDQEAAFQLAMMSAINIPAKDIVPASLLLGESNVGVGLRTLLNLFVDVPGGTGADYVGLLTTKIMEGAKKGLFKIKDVSRGLVESIIKIDKSLANDIEPFVETVAKIPDISPQEARVIVNEAVENVIRPEKVIKTRQVPVKPGELSTPNMVRNADGTFAKTETVNYKKFEPGVDPVPEPNKSFTNEVGQVYVEETAPVTKATEALPSEAQKGLEGAVAGEIPKVVETPKMAAKAKLDESIAKLKVSGKKYFESETGALNDPEGQQFYNDLKDTMVAAIEYGVKSAEEFAQYAGVRLTESMKKAWGEVAEPKEYTIFVETPEQKTVVDKISNLLDQIKPDIEANKQLLHEFRSNKAAQAAAIRAEKSGQDAAHAALGVLRGRSTKIGFEPLGASMTDAEKTILYDIMNKTPDLREYTKVALTHALDKIIDTGEALQPNEMMLLEYVYGRPIADKLLEPQKAQINIANEILQGLNLGKATLASVDFSAGYRQGQFFFWSHPQTTAGAFMDGFKAVGGKKYTNQLVDRIMQSEFIEQLSEAKVYFGLLGKKTGKMTEMEEAFISKWVDKIPFLKQSQDAYLSFLDHQRLAVGEDILRSAKKLGADINDADFLKNLGNLLNWGSGRGTYGTGTFGKALSMESPIFNMLLFSPRYLVSRLELLAFPFTEITRNVKTGVNIGEALVQLYKSPLMREWTKGAATLTAANLSILGMLKAFGIADVETNTNSADWGKARIGNVTFDLWAGYAQWGRLFSQLITGEGYDATSQARYPINRLNALENFLRNKSAPLLGFILDKLQDRKQIEPATFDNPVIQEVWNRLAPLAIQDTIDGAHDAGLLGGLLTGVTSMFGVGVQVGDEAQRIQSAFTHKKNEFSMIVKQANDFLLAGDKESAKKVAAANKDAGLYLSGKEYKSHATDKMNFNNSKITKLKDEIKVIEKDKSLGDRERNNQIEQRRGKIMEYQKEALRKGNALKE